MTSKGKAKSGGKRARRKGAVYEREVVRLFREAMPGARVERGLQSRGGDQAPDVDCPVFWVECKRGKQPNPRAALNQATEDAPEGRVPIAVIRDDYKDAFMVMGLTDFLAVVKQYRIGRDGDVTCDECGGEMKCEGCESTAKEGCSSGLEDLDQEWEQAAKRLYEALNPGELWWCFPVTERDHWVRSLRGD